MAVCPVVWAAAKLFLSDVKTRRRCTLFTIYLTPENGTHHLLSSMSFCSGKKMAKVTCGSSCGTFLFAWFVFQTPGGNFTQVYIIFLLPEEKILLKCPCSRFRLMQQSPTSRKCFLCSEKKVFSLVVF